MPAISRFREYYGQIFFLLCLLLILMITASGAVEIVPGGPGLRTQNTPPGLFTSAEFVLLAVAGIGLAVLLPVLPPITASLLPLVAMAGPLVLNYIFPSRQAFIPMEFSLMVILILFVANVLMGYFRETHARQRIVNIFGQYVPPQVAAEISRYPDRISLAGESRRLTVFFCDLKNFSNIAEQLNPRQLTLLLNEYFTSMTEILFRHEATIDKYIGDSIMAFWGAPLPQEDHAARSVRAALEMQKEIKTLSGKFTRKGWPALSMGIGINTGMMNVGNMGSRYRVTYTVVGDAVNLASRLEALTRVYHVPCIVSENTMQETKGVLFRELDVVRVKGKHNKTRIYEPLCDEKNADDSIHEMLQYHKEAMDSYRDADWRKADKLFSFLANNYADDGFYSYMLEKARKNGGS